MNVKVIGIGAAGNKAAICAVTNSVLRDTDILLMNTAFQDIPEMYKTRSLLFGNTTTGGCGKERKRSQTFISNFIENDNGLAEAFNQLISPGDLVVIVASTEGGTGSGAAPVIAAYINEVIGVRPQLIAFTGTEDDLRGLQNTLDFFKDCSEMCEGIVVQAISNKKYMSVANNNKLKAEQLANMDFVNRVKVLQGSILRESTQNIDAMDHLKLVTTAGYMSIESITSTEAIENVSQFNDLCEKMINSSKSLSTGSDRLKRLGIVLTIDEDDKDNIDWTFEKIKSQFAEIGEVFLHVQTTRTEERQIVVIMCGMEMPIKFVTATYEKFKARMSKSAKETDFGKTMASIKTDALSMDMDNPLASGKNITSSKFLDKLNSKKAANSSDEDSSSLKDY